MKIFFSVFLTLLVGCAGAEKKPETQLQWALDPQNKPQMDQFFADEKECKRFAFETKVRGSKYFESDIFVRCLKARGYGTKWVEVGSNAISASQSN
jgi:hypothetical protein